MSVLLGRPTVLLEELIMFSKVSFALGAVTMLEAKCKESFIAERWRTNINKHKKTIEKDQQRPVKFTININY